jgi:hypothetical protein
MIQTPIHIPNQSNASVPGDFEAAAATAFKKEVYVMNNIIRNYEPGFVQTNVSCIVWASSYPTNNTLLESSTKNSFQIDPASTMLVASNKKRMCEPPLQTLLHITI